MTGAGRTTDDLLREHRFLAGVSRGTLALLSESAKIVRFDPGALLLREGEDAGTIFLVTRGRVAIEIHAPSVGPIVIDTVEPGHVVGLSWMAAPFRWQFDARALEPVEAVAIDAQHRGRISRCTRKRLPSSTSASPLCCWRGCRPLGSVSSTSTPMPATDLAIGSPALRSPLTPVPYRIVKRRVELDDVVTMSVVPVRAVAGEPFGFAHGQFNMLTAFGVGEAAISISSAPEEEGPIEHTVRDVGAVTRALCAAPVGSVIGVRGPFGQDWGLGTIDDAADVVVVAGGIGLAPLRGAIRDLVERRRRRRVGSSCWSGCARLRSSFSPMTSRRGERPGSTSVSRSMSAHPVGMVRWVWSPCSFPKPNLSRLGRWRCSADLRS